MKKLFHNFEPKITLLVIPLVGYLKQSEFSKEIKIPFEEIMRMVTEKDRDISVIALL
jgi:hypothetical protein